MKTKILPILCIFLFIGCGATRLPKLEDRGGDNSFQNLPKISGKVSINVERKFLPNFIVPDSRSKNQITLKYETNYDFSYSPWFTLTNIPGLNFLVFTGVPLAYIKADTVGRLKMVSANGEKIVYSYRAVSRSYHSIYSEASLQNLREINMKKINSKIRSMIYPEKE